MGSGAIICSLREALAFAAGLTSTSIPRFRYFAAFLLNGFFITLVTFPTNSLKETFFGYCFFFNLPIGFFDLFFFDKLLYIKNNIQKYAQHIISNYQNYMLCIWN